MSKADRPDQPNAASRFNEDKATYMVRGEGDTPDLEAGMAAIREVLNTLPTRPGVYRMQDKRGDVLYVGKARSLKSRVGAYVQMNRLPHRLLRMVAQTRSMTIVTTGSEAEALLLEAQLIKKFRPAYNVLLRDDKSFPFILLREGHDFPRITKHRGAQRVKGQYFGPFASAGSVNRTINALQKLFLLRSCTDSFFNNRSRPCLLYQIKRCSAPCVDRISKDDYAELVDDARDFLCGKSTDVQQKLGQAMEQAAGSLDFEMAAIYRDRLKALTFIQGNQAINAAGLPDADIFALAAKGSSVCVQAFFIRGGQNWGHRSFFPAHTSNVDIEEVFSSFLMQFYDQMPPPKLVLLDRELPDAELLAEALSTKADYRVSVSKPQRGDRRKLLTQASRNAEEALDRRLAETSTQARIMREMVELLELDAVPDRIEIYDNSHIQGTNMVGGMVVAGPEGFRKNAYRKFNIKNPDIAPGDDFAMMREVLERRFSRAQKEDPDRDKGEWPDLVLIDGGKGQMSAARDALAEIGVEDVVMIGVSKGPDRNAGRETFHLPDGRMINLPMNSPVLFYLQRLRDEAHRFAIGAHRTRRAKSVGHSSLDDVPGIGPSRKKALLLHFGTARAVKNASLDDLQGAPGVSATVAQKIYDFFHG
ncbi:MAG: excinuclease ABC subunit UvrC [Sphingomonadales bacterium]|nr:excinuclease ABC subunit UvrC [Sphingomonadales bacterium]PIX65900.1 MAG: excinuclease ABC subunit C [Sphingomonadales bacterium CG_4_10_14_3_um_filter_58_15]NCO48917.1 excinuclease ABC subunit UvrC [Sphingomonadales bacterium]NCP01288.1 excinuclease ABC subunit UvrC [Sphingomonadales bacterium]NCP25483.1 excinuclease ABC subunit UvrC [Sphingomonadales bacterium]